MPPPGSDPFGADPFASASDPFAPATTTQAAQPKSRWGDYAGMAIRGLGGFLGSEGMLPGAAIQGGADLLAQTAEKYGGSRKDYNLAETGTSAAIGAVPFGKYGSTAMRYLKSALFGGGSAAAMDVAKQLGEGGDQPYDFGQTLKAGESGTVLGVGGAAVGHGLEEAFGRAKPVGSGVTRDVLRQEAAAATTTPKYFQSREDVAATRSNGGPGVHPTPSTPQGPLTPRDQLMGIDPERITPRERQTPQLRQPSNVRDVEGPISGALDAPRGPGNQGGEGLPPEMGSRRIPLETPERPFDTGPVGSDPFEIAPAPLSDKFLRQGKATMARPRTTVTDAEIAADKNSHQAFMDRFMAPFTRNEELESRAGRGPRDASTGMPSEQIAAAAERPTVQGPHGPVNAKLPYVPSEIASVYQTLKPKWADTAAATGVNMHEDPLDFNRRVLGSDNPRKLMGAERKALAQVKAKGKPILLGQPTPSIPSSPPGFQEGGFADHLTDFVDDESGSIDPELARRLGLHVGSAAIGAGVGAATSDPEHRLRDTVGGAATGAVLPLAFSKGGRAQLSKGRYFGMLSSAGAQAKNLAGNAGSTVVRAGEEALTGNTQGAKDILASVFSRDTAERMIEAFKNSDNPGDSRWGATSGVLGIPSRVMHAVDEGATQGLERGGLSHDEAKLSLFTSDPRSQVGQKITALAQKAPYLVPFARTGMNMVERGMEHMPGIGLLPEVRAMRGDSNARVMARQAMGGLAMVAGGAVGSDNPYVSAALGPLALPFAAGTAARTAYDKRTGDPFTNVAKSQTDLLRKELPLPTDAYDFDPGRYLASYVPSVLRDASVVDPKTLEQDGLFDPAIAKIPFLNSALLKRKPKHSARAGR